MNAKLGKRRSPGSEADVGQRRHVTRDGAAESLMRIECGTEMALRLYDVLTADGNRIRVVVEDEARRIETRIDADLDGEP